MTSVLPLNRENLNSFSNAPGNKGPFAHFIAPNIRTHLSAIAWERLAASLTEDNSARRWCTILQQMQDYQFLSVFDSELISRWDNTWFTDKEIINFLEQLFAFGKISLRIFLKLASTYRLTYYSLDEFHELISHFSKFQKDLGGYSTSSLPDIPPCFDQEGKEWLQSIILECRTHNAALAQLAKQDQKQDVQRSSPFAKAQINYSSAIRNLGSFQNKYVLKKAEFHRLLKMLTKFEIPTCHSSTKFLEILEQFWKIKTKFGGTAFMFLTHPMAYPEGVTASQLINFLQKLIESDMDVFELEELSKDICHNSLSYFHPQFLRYIDALRDSKNSIRFMEDSLDQAVHQFFSRMEQPLPNTREQEQITAQAGIFSTVYQSLKHVSLDELVIKAKAIQESCREEKIIPSDKRSLTLVAIACRAFQLKIGIHP